MEKKKVLSSLLGAVLLGLTSYAGYSAYDAYTGVNESDLLLANAEALADDESGDKIECYNEFIDVSNCGKRTVYKCYPCGESVKCEQALRPGKCTP